MTIAERQVGDVTILDIEGRIVIQDGADSFRAEVRQLVALSRVRLVLNLGGVPYIDSTGLSEIVRVYLSTTRRHGGVRLLHVTPRVLELLVVTKLVSVLDLFDEESEAVKSFGTGSGK